MNVLVRNLVGATIISFSLLGCKSTLLQDENSRFVKITEQIQEYRKKIDPYQQKEGVDGYFLENLSADFLRKKYEDNKTQLAQLESINQAQLSANNKINYAIMHEQVKNQVDEYEFNAHFMPLTSEFGFHSGLSFMVSATRLKSAEDYENYLNRLKAIPRFFDENIFWMRKGIAAGLTQPKAVLVGYEDSISAFIHDNPADSVFYSPLKHATGDISKQAFKDYQQQALLLIEQQVVPAYKNYLVFFTNEYQPNARADIGISSTPNGKAFYENRVRYYTTTDMTAEQVHQLGLQEVKRIRAEMDAIIQQVGFQGSFKEFVDFLRTDPQFYAKTPEELLKQASYIAKKMDAQLPKLFKNLPRTPYGVAPVPDAIAPKYTTGRYVGANRDDEPGYYWVNTYGLDKRPLYVLEALTLHEAVPGHHLQISLNKELEDIPDYRRNHYISAFGEGWGLYSEWLGLEAGFYQDPYSNFGRLTYEMWRAARLVVDTGMHMFGWSREQAMQFMADNSALSLHNIKTETDRYISWPGQALSYKIGELTIKRLRAKAQQELGTKFDVREFHHQVLKNGSVPLNLLEQQIDEYIQQTLAQ